MIVSKTPLRVSFFGGGTDFKEYYEEHEGAVISTAIDKFVYVIVKPNVFDNDIIINSYEKEKVSNVDHIKHGIIREAIKKAQITKGVQIVTFSDLPLEGTGLGSSSALTVGMLNALFAYTKNALSAHELAELACHIETDILNEPIGKQDQYSCAFGGFREFHFCKNGKVQTNEIALSDEAYGKIASHMLLFHTGIQRRASSILSDQKKKIGQNIDELHQLKEIVKESYVAWSNADIEMIGALLSRNWEIKKKLSNKIQNETIETMYALGMQSGSLGGKLLGAGGGGYFCYLCPPERQAALCKALKGFNELPVAFEKKGSRISAIA